MKNPKNARVNDAEKETILTREGLRKLEEELEHLKGTRRKEVAERIKQAKAFGDLAENAEYDDAKNEQAFIEGRILQIEQMLRSARVIDDAAVAADVISVGSTVRLKDVAAGSELTYTIVGSAEADPLEDRISNESPVGRALLGRKKGETITIRVPAGTLKYTVLDIVR
ncbi:MAG: transcription elongation factor GreA [Armatimonadota bacterium]|nr:transcription elongation factor GreA [Armatimonadota bacterium]MDR7486922.1 transcription elongation factor GreA [Armatimonadota bacterium]MDR7534540.1 transcription elongation factor GreA [Armatimonadota bacterium]MDR7537633.1 transcription elongation factor GreA [Armatimonadota bacterium]